MKTLANLFGLLFLIIVMTGCPGSKETTDVTPTGDDYQKLIDAKFSALGWDKDGHARLNGSLPVKTAGGKGYVQYYAIGNGQSAIYYFPGKGAFGVNEVEMRAYDAVGQDKWGLIVSDPKGTVPGACGHNDIVTNDGAEGIITCQTIIHGSIYKKYKEANRWDGPLGLPTSGIMLTPANATDKGTFITFKNGGIWSTPSTGTQAIWGKAHKMWAAQDWERGWLKFPITSCDLTKADNLQTVDFQGGLVRTGPTCPSYLNKNNETVYLNGTRAANVSSIPCYL